MGLKVGIVGRTWREQLFTSHFPRQCRSCDIILNNLSTLQTQHTLKPSVKRIFCWRDTLRHFGWTGGPPEGFTSRARPVTNQVQVKPNAVQTDCVWNVSHLRCNTHSSQSGKISSNSVYGKWKILNKCVVLVPSTLNCRTLSTALMTLTGAP